MRNTQNSLIFLAIIGPCLLGVQTTIAAKIQFFGREDFQDLLHVSESAEQCTNVPNELQDKLIGSVKTELCLSMYKRPDCTAGILWTGPGSLRQLASYVYLGGSHRVEYPVNSYRACNGRGGQPIDLDIYGKEDQQGPIVLEVRKLDGCLSLEDSLDKLTLSANNRGNGFYVWGERNCTGPMKEVPGGVGVESENLNANLKDYSVEGHGTVYKYHDVKSISPQ